MKIILGIIIGFIIGVLAFIILGSVLEFFSISKPSDIYRHHTRPSLINYFLIFYPIVFMIIGSFIGGIIGLKAVTKYSSEQTKD